MSHILNKQANAQEGDEIDLSAILDQLLENRWLILFITLCVFTLGVFYSSRQIPQYQSDVLLQIEAGQSSLGQSGGAAQFMFRSPTVDITSTQIALMQSRFILEPVIKSLGLDVSAVPDKSSFWAWLKSPSKKTIQVTLFEVHKTFHYCVICQKPWLAESLF